MHAGSGFLFVMRGLDPRIPLRRAPCLPKRDGGTSPAMTKKGMVSRDYASITIFGAARVWPPPCSWSRTLAAISR